MAIPIHKIENYTDLHRLKVLNVVVLKRGDYFVDDSVTIDGDAPKKFIGVYDYKLLNHKHKCNHNNWVRYIAKTGHKWYPNESITEFLLNRLGVAFGLRMADSRLAMIGGQLRFLSRYFLNPSHEELIHGADVIAGYLNETPDYVEEVDQLKLTRDLFTLQVIEKAVEHLFPYQKEDIMHDLVKLVIFDALVGNNDRHFFNWGIIRSIESRFKPYFSPIYDTARGLFWNYSENKVNDILVVNKTIDAQIKKYCKGSRPKIGWEGVKDPNHFQLFQKIYDSEFFITGDEVKALLSQNMLFKMLQEIQTNFRPLLSENRVILISKCLEYRFNEMRKML
jgi:hypothetical protein